MKSVTDPCHTDPHQSTRQFVRGAIANWLRTTGKQGVSLLEDDKPLYQLAIDSLGIIEIATSLERGSGKRLNPELIYELETISEIAEYLDSLPVTNAVTAPPPPSGAQLEPPVSSEITTPSSSLAGSSLLTRYQLLNRRVDSLEENGRYFFEPVISQHDGAWVIADGQRMLMLASYEYLGLLSHQRLKDSAVETVNEFGTGLHGTRLLAGTTSIHRQLEAKLSSFMGTDDAIVFNSGYITNLAVISALVGPGDRIIGDQWNHASIVDGCRLSGADLIRFDHNNVGALEESLRLSPEIPTLVVVDAVYSMDGDIAPIRDIVQLCREYNALLMVDEAHSLGVLGNTGRGIQEHFDLDDQDINIKMGTLSKTLACSGGFVAACDDIVRYLRHHARGYIFSGSLPPSQAHAAMAALDILQEEPALIPKLWRNVENYSTGLRSLGFDIGNTMSPIVPIMTGNIDTALNMTEFCRAAGLLVIPVCFPAVPMDSPRLRTCVSAIHTDDDIRFALDTLANAGRAVGLIV